jgi:hypothetical protein
MNYKVTMCRHYIYIYKAFLTHREGGEGVSCFVRWCARSFSYLVGLYWGDVGE